MGFLKQKLISFYNRPFLGLLILTVCGYLTSLANGFMLDDFLVLFNESGVSNKTFGGLFTDSQHIFFRPVGHVIMWFSYHMFKADPLWYHLLNLALFFGISLLFYVIVDKISHNPGLAFLTAALYAVHPINSMLVNYVTATVITTFVLNLQVSFLFFLKYLDSRRKSFFAVSLLFFVFGLFSHEMSMMFPAYIFCLMYFLKSQGFKKSVLWSVPFVLVAVAYFVFRWYFFSLKGVALAVSAVVPVFNVYISSVVHLIYWYMAKLFLPQNIVFLWTGVIEKNFSPIEIFRFFVIVTLVLYLIFIRWQKGLKAFALGIFAVGFIPVFWASYAYFPFSEPLIEPHWFYFSSLGFFILVGQGILFVQSKINHGFGKYVFAGVLAFLFIFLQLNNLNWKDQETYCRFWLKQNTDNTTPYYGMGQVMLARGDGKSAISYFNKGLELSRHHKAFILADAGYAYYLAGEQIKAQEFWEMALKDEPQYSGTYYYLALLSWEKGELGMAEKYLLQAQSLYPKSNLYSKELSRLRAGLAVRHFYPFTFVG